MRSIKVKYRKEIPLRYTGIVKIKDEGKFWFKNGKWHREDGPAKIWNSGYKSWYLDDKIIWASNWAKFDLKYRIILSKEPHPEYPNAQIWKWIDQYGVWEQVIIPGMKEFIIE